MAPRTFFSKAMMCKEVGNQTATEAELGTTAELLALAQWELWRDKLKAGTEVKIQAWSL